MIAGIDHNNQDEVAELAAAYALDALDADQRRALEEHLPSCEQCSRAVAEMQEVAAALPFAVEQVAPPEHVKTRLMDRIRAEQEPAGRPGGATRPRFSLSAFLAGRWLPLAASAAALVLLLGMGAMLLQQRAQISDLQAQVDRQKAQLRQQAAQINQKRTIDALVSAPQSTMATMRAGEIQAKMVMSPNHNKAYLVVTGLPPLPAGRDYQVWLMEQDKPVSVGVFHSAGEGRWVLEAPEALKSYTWIGITQEPRGGSKQPTTEPLMGSDLQ